MFTSWLFIVPISYRYVDHVNEIRSPLAHAAESVAFPAQALALMVVVWNARTASAGRYDAMRYHAAAVLGFIAFGKVFSPQYMLWPLPILALVRGSFGVQARALFLAAAILTTWVYPWGLTSLMDFEPWTVTLLNVRNLLLIALWAFLTFRRTSFRFPTRRAQGLFAPESSG